MPGPIVSWVRRLFLQAPYQSISVDYYFMHFPRFNKGVVLTGLPSVAFMITLTLLTVNLSSQFDIWLFDAFPPGLSPLEVAPIHRSNSLTPANNSPSHPSPCT